MAEITKANGLAVCVHQQPERRTDAVTKRIRQYLQNGIVRYYKHVQVCNSQLGGGLTIDMVVAPFMSFQRLILPYHKLIVFFWDADFDVALKSHLRNSLYQV